LKGIEIDEKRGESSPVDTVTVLERPDGVGKVVGSSPIIHPNPFQALSEGFFILNFFCYILESESTGKLYIGQTNDIEDRLRRHNSGYVLSTRNRGPWRLLFYRRCDSRSESVLLERKLKSMKSAEKVRQWTQSQC